MPKALRLSLVQQTVLLLVATVLLAVTALGGVVAWNLRSGFSEYLRLQDLAWLERFAAVAGRAVEREGLQVLSGGPGALRPLLDAAGPLAGVVSDRPPPRQRRGPPGAERDGPPGGRPEGAPPSPPEWAPEDRGGPPPGARYAQRLSIVDPAGQLLAGRPPPDGERPAEQPIRAAGAVVAIARQAPGPPAGRNVDAAFLARQYRGILIAALALTALAVAGAVLLGRRWLRPVQDVRQAAHRIAAGAFDTRVVPRGRDELTDLAHDINAMASSLQSLEASRRRWIAELSHEMRTPLAVLRGEVECLIDGVRPLDMAAVQSLQAEVARLTRLVEDFHQLALSDLRALPCTCVPLDAAALVREVAARWAPRLQEAGLRLDLRAPPGPVDAQWDAQRIGQLLDNLLENSLRYTDAPGRLLLALDTPGAERLTLTLDDSPPGVPAAELPRLFEPLYRVDPSRSRASGGSGLGLAICLAIARSHGGRMIAAASPLGGLRILVDLARHVEPSK
jgi:two-component system sensor histidine kinase BaeS